MDLLSPRPFWPMRDGLPATFPPLTKNTSCDVAIIGGGISGALIALALVEAGLDVVVVDRREVAHGSTAGNTGLMLHELDEMLHELTPRLGRAAAERAFRRCRKAIDGLEAAVKKQDLDCGFVRRKSVYVAATRRDVPRLRREFEARRAAGLDSEWWSRARIERESSLPHAAAIGSPGAAQLDAYRLTYGLLLAAQEAGARIHDRTSVVRRTWRRGGIELTTSRATRVRARQVVVATGYEAEAFLPRRYGKLHSTFALVSEPLPPGALKGWPADEALVWDTGDPYLYLRTTTDGRVMIGGGDEPFRDPQARDRMLGAKAAMLQRQFRRLMPRIPLEVATAWAGTFGVTDDALPYIGQHHGVPHTWFALGFGGNGTTFSVIAAEIIRAGILGGEDPDADLFRFERAG